MKLSQMFFIFLTFGIIKFMVVTTFFPASLDTYTFQQLDIGTIPGVSICNENDSDASGLAVDCSTACTSSSGDPTSCDVTILGIGDRCDYVGCSIVNATIDIGLFVYVIILFAIRAIVFAIKLSAFMTIVLITSFPGAPWYINAIMLTPFILMFFIIVFKLLVSIFGSASGNDSA